MTKPTKSAPWLDPQANILAGVREQAAKWDQAQERDELSPRLAHHLAPDRFPDPNCPQCRLVEHPKGSV